MRAVGDVLRDQLFYMARVGFDAFLIAEGHDLDVALAEVWQIWPPTESAVPNPLASELISRGHSGADWLCERLTLLERGQISDDVLLAWGSERAFRFAQERATSTGECLKVFLILDAQRRQVSIRQAGTELAHDLPERPELRESLAKDLPRAMLAERPRNC